MTMCGRVAVSGVLRQKDEVVGWVMLLLDHGEAVGNGDIECSRWLRRWLLRRDLGWMRVSTTIGTVSTCRRVVVEGTPQQGGDKDDVMVIKGSHP